MLSVTYCCAFALLQPAAGLEVPRAAVAAVGPTRVAGMRPVLRSHTALQRQSSAQMLAAAATPGGASVTNSIINLSKNIVGAGVLALAAGVAAFSASPVAIVPALILMLFLGGVSGYSFSLIARVGDEVGADTYKDTWSKVFGDSLSIIPALTVAFKTYVGGLSYAIILGDSFSSIATLAGAPAALRSSNTWIVLLSTLVLLPLSLMRDLSSLAIGSVIGTAGALLSESP